MEETLYLSIPFRGQEAIVTSKRVLPVNRKDGLFYYELRHADDWGVPETLEPFVGSDFFGTLITKDMVELGQHAYDGDKDFYIELEESEKELMSDWNEPMCTIDEFLNPSGIVDNLLVVTTEDLKSALQIINRAEIIENTKLFKQLSLDLKDELEIFWNEASQFLIDELLYNIEEENYEGETTEVKEENYI